MKNMGCLVVPLLGVMVGRDKGRYIGSVKHTYDTGPRRAPSSKAMRRHHKEMARQERAAKNRKGLGLS